MKLIIEVIAILVGCTTIIINIQKIIDWFAKRK